MSRREDHASDLDALLRRAAAADPPPPHLEARVRARLARETAAAHSPQPRSPVLARLAAAGSLAAAASVAVLLLRPPAAGPPARGEPDAPLAEPDRPRLMRAAGPASADALPRARVLDARGAIPVSLESTDPSITIVWMLPGSSDEKTELH